MGWWRGSPAILLAAVLVAFGPCIQPATLNYDTPWLVVNNPLLSPGDPGVIPRVFRDMDLGTRLALGAEYLPVRDLTVLLDFAVAGADFRLHHASSLAWYALGVVGTWWLLARVLARCRVAAWAEVALAATLLWAIHPTRVENVAWLAGRKDVVALAFGAGALLAGTLARDRGRAVLAWSAACLGLLALWSKGTAVAVPALQVLVAWVALGERPWTYGRGGLGGSAAWLASWLPWAVCVGLGLAVSVEVGRVVGMYAPSRASSAVDWVLLQGWLTAHYLGSLVWPVHLSVLYAEPSSVPSEPATWWGLVAWAGLVAVAVALPRRWPAGAFGAGWWLLALLPVSHLLPLQNLVADRYLLVPSLGLTVLAVAALARLVGSRGTLLAAAIVAVPLVLASRARCAVFADSVALWHDARVKAPELARAWTGEAGALSARGDSVAAWAVLQEGAAVLPPGQSVDGAMAALLLEHPGLPGAEGVERTLRAALAFDPEDRQSLNNLASLLHREGRLAEALPVARRLVEVHPLYPTGWNSLAAVQLGLGDVVGAGASLERALTLDPFSSSARCNLGGARYLAGDHPGAARAWRACLELRPGDRQALAGLRHLGLEPASGP